MALSRERAVDLSHRILERLRKAPGIALTEEPEQVRNKALRALLDWDRELDHLGKEIRAKIAAKPRPPVEGSRQFELLFAEELEKALASLLAFWTGGDTGRIDDLVASCQSVDALVIESTYLEEEAELAKKFSHLTAKMAAELAVAAGVRQLILTHISRRYREAAEHYENLLQESSDLPDRKDLLEKLASSFARSNQFDKAIEASGNAAHAERDATTACR